MSESRYPVFFEETFLHEGYFQDLPEDKGNWYDGKLYGTICGITARDHIKEFMVAKQLYNLGKRELLKEYAMKFYEKKGYWDDRFDEIIDSSLAYKLFDLGVNMGSRTSIKILQKTLNKHYGIDITPTGDLDLRTLVEANTAYYRPHLGKYDVPTVEGESILYACYVFEAKKYYTSLKGFGKFGRNWLRRLAKIMNNSPDKIDIAIQARPTEKIKGVI